MRVKAAQNSAVHHLIMGSPVRPPSSARNGYLARAAVGRGLPSPPSPCPAGGPPGVGPCTPPRAGLRPPTSPIALHVPALQRASGHEAGTGRVAGGGGGSHAAGVEHDADLAADGRGRQVLLELGADRAGAAVRAGDLAPDGPVLGALLLRLGLVHVGQALAKVELGLGLGVDAVNLDQAGVGVLVALAPAWGWRVWELGELRAAGTPRPSPWRLPSARAFGGRGESPVPRPCPLHAAFQTTGGNAGLLYAAAQHPGAAPGHRQRVPAAPPLRHAARPVRTSGSRGTGPSHTTCIQWHGKRKVLSAQRSPSGGPAGHHPRPPGQRQQVGVLTSRSRHPWLPAPWSVL